jgi:hypothetical protein
MAVIMHQELQVLLIHLADMEVLVLVLEAQRAQVDSPFLNGYTVECLI